MAILKPFFYVEARMVDGLVSFKHVPISARNEEGAYREGSRMLAALRLMGHPDEGHSGGAFLNDYVIPVPWPV